MIQIATFGHVEDAFPKPMEAADFRELLELFHTPYQRLDKSNGPLFSPTEFQPGTRRRNASAVRVHFGVLDFDDLTTAETEEVRRALDPYEHIWHTTWSHGAAQQRKPPRGRYRALIALSRPVEAAQWADFWPRMAARFGAGRGLDTSCHEPARFYFFPAIPEDEDPASFVCLYHPGEPLVVEEVLADPKPDFARPPPRPKARRSLPPSYKPSEWAVNWGAERLKHHVAQVKAIDDAEGPMYPALNGAAYAIGQLTPHLLDAGEAAGALLNAALHLNPGREEKYVPIIEKGILDGQQEPFTPEPRYRWTDTGNAERVAHMFEGHIRHVASWKRWIVWDGATWRLQPDIQPQVKEAAEEIHREVEQINHPLRRKEAKAWALRSESAGARRAAEFLAQSEPGIRIDHTELDVDPWILGVGNGLLDLRTGTVRRAGPEDLVTKRTDVPFDPQAEAPRWERFLLEIMGGDEELVAYLQRAVGYTLTGETGEQKLFFLHGKGANGKSTFVNTLLNLFGDYGGVGAPELLMAKRHRGHPTEQAALYGQRLVSCQEVEQGRFWDEALLKQLTGGDPITARRMNEDFWTFTPTHKFWVSGNHKPAVRGTDDGIWRRLVLVPFEVSFKDRPDPLLPLHLLEELPGILAWAVRGCLQWQRLGSLGEPRIVSRAIEDYRTEQDVVGQFISDRCIVGPDEECSRRQLRTAYELWCEDEGDKHPWSPRAFNENLRSRGFQEVRLGGTSERGWKGLRPAPALAAVPLQKSA